MDAVEHRTSSTATTAADACLPDLALSFVRRHILLPQEADRVPAQGHAENHNSKAVNRRYVAVKSSTRRRGGSAKRQHDDQQTCHSRQDEETIMILASIGMDDADKG